MRKNALTPLFKILPNTILANWDGTPTQAIINTQSNLAAQAINEIVKKNKPYFLQTPYPNTASGFTAGQDAFRLNLRTDLLTAVSSGIQVPDFEIVSNGATPARYNTSLTTDGVHPNEAGHDVLAAEIISKISKYFIV